jgi:twitching motility two-component system response regulator PilG
MNISNLETLDTTETLPKNLTIMVIDDSKTVRRTAEILLSEHGCKVLTANDGFESLAMIASYRPDMIFVDIMMPRLDGYQTCALIKGNPEYRDIPVVMLSSKDSIFDMAHGRLSGSESYITKPFTRSDLLAAIQKHVPQHKQSTSTDDKSNGDFTELDLELTL